jgi:hypothetical protein
MHTLFCHSLKISYALFLYRACRITKRLFVEALL